MWFTVCFDEPDSPVLVDFILVTTDRTSMGVTYGLLYTKKKNAIQIENVQRRATKLVKNIKHMSYA
jgi:hypothetical protein